MCAMRAWLAVGAGPKSIVAGRARVENVENNLVFITCFSDGSRMVRSQRDPGHAHYRGPTTQSDQSESVREPLVTMTILAVLED